MAVLLPFPKSNIFIMFSSSQNIGSAIFISYSAQPDEIVSKKLLSVVYNIALALVYIANISE
jgi:hypothetical protein